MKTEPIVLPECFRPTPQTVTIMKAIADELIVSGVYGPREEGFPSRHPGLAMRAAVRVMIALNEEEK